MNKKILFLRVSYWIGIVIDAYEAVRLTLLRYSALPQNLEIQGPLIGGLFGIGQGMALMWGWTLLLFWADRRPMERRGVLLLTVVPVMVLIFSSTVNMAVRYTSLANEGLSVYGGIALMALFTFSYFYTGTRRKEKSQA